MKDIHQEITCKLKLLNYAKEGTIMSLGDFLYFTSYSEVYVSDFKIALATLLSYKV